jgi:hypothetical protein
MDQVRAAIVETLSAYHPMTDRQVFYRVEVRGAIAKTEREYKNTIVRLLGIMRRGGTIPFEWIADNTRWMRKPRTYSGLDQALRRTAETYRRAVWDEQDAYVEVWVEKDALAGVIYEVTEAWDVPLMVARGYASLSFLHAAAETIEAEGKSAFLYYFGDYDPSGVDISRVVEETIREFAPDAEIHFERVAITPEQIEQYALPTRPTKATDSRGKDFEGDSVELDSLPPDVLRELVEDCITQHIDFDTLDRLRVVEAAERETLLAITKERRS